MCFMFTGSIENCYYSANLDHSKKKGKKEGILTELKCSPFQSFSNAIYEHETHKGLKVMSVCENWKRRAENRRFRHKNRQN